MNQLEEARHPNFFNSLFEDSGNELVDAYIDSKYSRIPLFKRIKIDRKNRINIIRDKEFIYGALHTPISVFKVRDTLCKCPLIKESKKPYNEFLYHRTKNRYHFNAIFDFCIERKENFQKLKRTRDYIIFNRIK
jgi:Mg2+/Co2+ transporter CorC